MQLYTTLNKYNYLQQLKSYRKVKERNDLFKYKKSATLHQVIFKNRFILLWLNMLLPQLSISEYVKFGFCSAAGNIQICT